jgi:hypothetical protein
MKKTGIAFAVLALTAAVDAQAQKYFARQHLTANGGSKGSNTPTSPASTLCSGEPVQGVIHRGFDSSATRHFNQTQGGPTPFQQAVAHCRSLSDITYCSIFDQGWTAMSHWYNDAAGTATTNDPSDYTITCQK